MRRINWRTTLSSVALLAVVTAACGGDDDDSSDDAATDAPPVVASDDATDSDAGDDGGDDSAAGNDSGTGGSVVLGEPTTTADPGSAWAEVGGERFDYLAAGSINYTCTITDQQVAINFQTPEGHDFLLQGSPQTGDWFLNLTFAQGGGDNARYNADSMGGQGVFTVGDGALSYEGAISRIIDFDVTNAEEIDGQVAVNCASPGGDPTATVGGETYTFPLSGAQSVMCEVSPAAIEVRINRLASDDLQLELSATDQGGQWVGAAVVFTADGNFTAPLPPDGTGLEVDGTSVTFEGTFQTPGGDEVEGSLDATC